MSYIASVSRVASFAPAHAHAGRRSARLSVACSAERPAGRRNIMLNIGAAVVAGGLLAQPALAADGVNFVSPKNGAKVSGPVQVQMAVSGLEVRPAADGVIEGTGHHHIIVDGAAPPVGEAIPFDETHLHFGKGQTEASVELPPGKHTLTLQFANAKHESYGSKFSKSVTVTVL